MTRSILLVASLACAAGCGADPVSYSAPVAISLGAKSGDVQSGTLTAKKDINTESGNPYAVFITDAHTALGGKDPGLIQVDKLTLQLGGTSTGASAFDQVYTGEVDVDLVMNDTNTTARVGTITSPTGSGPVAIDVSFDDTALAPADHAALVAGKWKVVLRGPAAAGFAQAGANVDLQLVFTFAAFE